MTEEKKTLVTVIMSDSPPVRIAEEDWPVLVNVWYTEGDGKCPANTTKSWRLVARKHADGRYLIYGVYLSTSPNTYNYHAGELVANPSGSELITVIRRVAAESSCGRLLDDFLVSLPPVDLV